MLAAAAAPAALRRVALVLGRCAAASSSGASGLPSTFPAASALRAAGAGAGAPVRWASASSRKSRGPRGPPARPLGIIGEAGADTDEQVAEVARWSVDGHGDGKAEAAAAARAAAAAAAASADGGGITSLRANPYGWEEQTPRSAPLWMLYEAAREERRLPEDRSAGASRLRDNPTEVRVPERDAKGRAYATGRRKEATARVWVAAGGDGAITVNGQALADYFPRMSDRQHALEPLVVTQTCGAVDVMVTVASGGMAGQAGAVRHGLANALARYDPYLKPALRRCAFCVHWGCCREAILWGGLFAAAAAAASSSVSHLARIGTRECLWPACRVSALIQSALLLPNSRPIPLRPSAVKLIQRDPRMVERKKPGQKKARKRFQWIKR
jgi:small subunit ribosomal protein S9